MSLSAPPTEPRQNALVLAVVAAAVVVGSLWLARQFREEPVLAMPPGSVAPAVKGVGWLNGKPVSAKDLKGKVTVLQAFAWWCPPCATEARKLVKLQQRYGDTVQFAGMTGEGEDKRDETVAFLKTHGVTWPVVYGAEESLLAWKVEYLPSLWVIGRDGKIAWSNEMDQPLEAAIDAALKAKPNDEKPKSTGK